MRHINGCDQGHSVVTGSLKTFGWVSKGFLVWSRGHRGLLGWVPRSPKDFWCDHRVTKISQRCRMGSRSSAVQSRVKELHTYSTSNGAASNQFISCACFVRVYTITLVTSKRACSRHGGRAADRIRGGQGKHKKWGPTK